ncbi:MAG: hypothetical protein K1X64_18340 [Myxococcaceae bacterium]|nr:hypothetical protein [Myxococcaceae bacterium]
MKQEPQQTVKPDGTKQAPSQSTPQLAPQPAFNDPDLTANPAAEALARFQKMQRALMGADLREALKQSPVLNPPVNPTPHQPPKALS